jgi:hypothetical protein
MVAILLVLFLIELKDKRKQKICFKIAALLTLFFIGLRAKSVGADTLDYVNNFLSGNHEYQEPLYNLYYLLVRGIWCDWRFYLVLSSFLSLLPLYYLVKKYASYKVLPILLFFIFWFYYVYFVAMRQVLATSIFFVGVMAVLDDKKHKWWIYATCTIISCFTHNFMVIVSLFFTAFYFISIRKKKTALILVAASGIIGVFFDAASLLRLFDAYFSLGVGITTERLNEYMTTAGVNDDMTVSILGQLYYSIIGFFIIWFIPDEKINHWFVKMYIVYVIVFSLFREIFMIDRIVMPFGLMGCITATWSLDIIRSKKELIPKLMAIVLIVYVLNGYVQQQINYSETEKGRMHPYYFNWENDSNHPSYYFDRFGTFDF